MTMSERTSYCTSISELREPRQHMTCILTRYPPRHNYCKRPRPGGVRGALASPGGAKALPTLIYHAIQPLLYPRPGTRDKLVFHAVPVHCTARATKRFGPRRIGPASCVKSRTSMPTFTSRGTISIYGVIPGRVAQRSRGRTLRNLEASVTTSHRPDTDTRHRC
jgi:hypothetical protein